MVFVNVLNQNLSARATVGKAIKKDSISKQFKVGVLFCLSFFLKLIFSQKKLRKNLQIRG